MIKHVPSSDIETSIADRFHAVADRFQDQSALQDDTGTLTYEELNNRCNCLAHSLLVHEESRNQTVAILLDHGISHIVSILAVLKTGRSYLSLDPSFPSSRLQFMLRDSSACQFVTDKQHRLLASSVADKDIRIFDLDQLDLSRELPNPTISVAPDQIANIFYTSGSTGPPKGVLQNHRNVLHNVADVNSRYDISADDRFALLISTSFAASQTPIFGALLNGATLCLYSLQRGRLLGLASWLLNERITLYLSVPSTFRKLCQTLPSPNQFPDLRQIVLGGEPVTKRDVELYKQLFSDQCVLCVRLASTETFTIRSYLIDKQTEVTGDTVPVGYPVKDKEVFLLTDQGTFAKPGQVGEITIKSPYLSPGYWNHPELTNSAFISDSNDAKLRIFRTGNLGRMQVDGCLEFLGRQDSQIKIRGYRVEPKETEVALRELNNIRDVAVVAVVDRRGEKYLVAYVVPGTDEQPSVETIRNRLEVKLPHYMIPSRFIFLSELPLTPTGKTDRRQLPFPGLKRPQLHTPYIAPRNKLEACLTQISEEILEVDPIGIRDRFVDLGADSLNYVQLALEIEKRFNSVFPLEQFIALPTIEQLANLIGQGSSLRNSEYSAHPWIKNDYRGLDDNTPSRKLIKLAAFSLMTLAGRLIPYVSASKAFAWVCHQPQVQDWFFSKRTHSVKQFLRVVRSSKHERRVIGEFLFSSQLLNLRLAQLARMPQSRFEECTHVQGFGSFENLVHRGQGLLLLNSHCGPPHFDMLILNRRGIDNVLTLGGWPTEIQLMGIKRWRQLKMDKTRVDHSERFLFSILALQHAETQLRNGGIVRIAPDSIHGTSGKSLPFLGRLRPFRAGFAQLALSTGAPVVPVFMKMGQGGKVHVEFLDALDTGNTTWTVDDRIDHLILQYAELLKRRWRDDTGSISQLSIRRFLELPFVEG